MKLLIINQHDSDEVWLLFMNCPPGNHYCLNRKRVHFKYRVYFIFIFLLIIVIIATIRIRGKNYIHALLLVCKIMFIKNNVCMCVCV